MVNQKWMWTRCRDDDTRTRRSGNLGHTQYGSLWYITRKRITRNRKGWVKIDYWSIRKKNKKNRFFFFSFLFKKKLIKREREKRNSQYIFMKRKKEEKKMVKYLTLFFRLFFEAKKTHHQPGINNFTITITIN